MALEHVRVSQQGKEYLIRLKRVTGIKNWNILCRWALCTSLAEPSIPPNTARQPDSNVEMTWRVFGGQYADLYLVLVKERCLRDGLNTDDATVADQVRLHLHRGIAYLAGNKRLRSIENLVSLAIDTRQDRDFTADAIKSPRSTEGASMEM